MYERLLTKDIQLNLFKGKIIILAGARQLGKTTLISQILEPYLAETAIFNCDNPSTQELLHNKDFDFLKKLIGTKRFIFIDEGQKVGSIGQTAKLLVDHYKNKKQIIIAGSSSINLLNSVQEALTGRKYVYILYPLSLQEICNNNYMSALKELETLMIFGNYPEIVTANTFTEKTRLLKELADSYLFKDILEFQQIKDSATLRNLLKALALQIGSEASYNELANLLGINKLTVERYIDLLEKNFIIFRLAPYVKNKRKEISKLKKIYFYDLGIRNALLNNFNLLNMRNDAGALWENFIIVERLKFRSYHHIIADQYFWRTYDGSEIDLIEMMGGKLYGYECKWNTKKKKITPPKKWLDYGNSMYNVITKENLDGFII